MKTKLLAVISLLLAITFFTSVTFAQDTSPWAQPNEIHTYTIPKLQSDANNHTRLVSCVVFSPDGKTIASGSRDKTIRLWNASDGTHVRTLQGKRVISTT